jgi:hypothetical protein
MMRPFQGRIRFVTLFRGLAPTAIRVHPLRGWEKACCQIMSASTAIRVHPLRGCHGFRCCSLEANNVNSRGCNPRIMSPITTGPERAEQWDGQSTMHRDAACAVGHFMVRPLQGRIRFVTLFRGLAPTAIRVHPLRGWGKACCQIMSASTAIRVHPLRGSFRNLLPRLLHGGCIIYAFTASALTGTSLRICATM